MAKVHSIAQEAVLVAIDISKKRNDVVYTDDFGIADDPARFFQCRNDVLPTIAKPGIYNWRHPRMGVHDCQDPQLAPSRQLVVNKVHRPHIVRADGWRAIFP